MIEGLLGVLVGGLGGVILWKAAGMAMKTAPGQPKDRLAELERLIGTYRAEVTDLRELVERRYRRDRKREEREADDLSPAEAESTEKSTAFPQAKVPLKTKAELRQAWWAWKVRNRG